MEWHTSPDKAGEWKPVVSWKLIGTLQSLREGRTYICKAAFHKPWGFLPRQNRDLPSWNCYWPGEDLKWGGNVFSIGHGISENGEGLLYKPGKKYEGQRKWSSLKNAIIRYYFISKSHSAFEIPHVLLGMQMINDYIQYMESLTCSAVWRILNSKVCDKGSQYCGELDSQIISNYARLKPLTSFQEQGRISIGAPGKQSRLEAWEGPGIPSTPQWLQQLLCVCVCVCSKHKTWSPGIDVNKCY